MQGRGSRLAAVTVMALAAFAFRPPIQQGLEAIRCGPAANRAVEFLRPHLPALAKGLRTRQEAILLDEFNVIAPLLRGTRIWVSVYYNARGEVRLLRPDPSDTAVGKIDWEYFQPPPVPGPEFEQAARGRAPTAVAILGGAFYQVAVPVVEDGRVLGIVGVTMEGRAPRHRHWEWTHARNQALIYRAGRIPTRPAWSGPIAIAMMGEFNFEVQHRAR